MSGRRKMHEVLDDMELALALKRLGDHSTNLWRDRRRLLERQRKLRLRQEDQKTVDDINRRWAGGNHF